MLCFSLFLLSAFLNSITSLHRDASEISLCWMIYHVVKVVQLAKGPKKNFLVISRIVWFMYCYVVIYKIAAQ